MDALYTHRLYWNPQVDPTADLASTASTMEARGYELVKDWHDGCTPGTDGCGFQNCRQYCANTDKATCFGDFVVPDVTTAGYYTFVWYWVFNRNTSPYTSCYEAYVEPASAEVFACVCHIVCEYAHVYTYIDGY